MTPSDRREALFKELEDILWQEFPVLKDESGRISEIIDWHLSRERSLLEKVREPLAKSLKHQAVGYNVEIALADCIKNYVDEIKEALRLIDDLLDGKGKV